MEDGEIKINQGKIRKRTLKRIQTEFDPHQTFHDCEPVLLLLSDLTELLRQDAWAGNIHELLGAMQAFCAMKKIKGKENISTAITLAYGGEVHVEHRKITDETLHLGFDVLDENNERKRPMIALIIGHSDGVNISPAVNNPKWYKIEKLIENTQSRSGGMLIAPLCYPHQTRVSLDPLNHSMLLCEAPDDLEDRELEGGIVEGMAYEFSELQNLSVSAFCETLVNSGVNSEINGA